MMNGQKIYHFNYCKKENNMNNNYQMTIPMRICARNDTISNWSSNNPILLKGELAIEYSDDHTKCYLKCGDGIHTFNDLPYISVPEPMIK